MNTTSTTGNAAVARPAPAPKARKSKATGGASLGQDSSREARRLAAAILEVLAGARTPAAAAAALDMSLPRYYQWESRALRGLLAACEAKPKGRRPSAAGELAALHQQHQRLQRELARQQALVRLGQRSVGLAPPAPAPAKGTGKRRRRPTARALSVAARLQQGPAQDTESVSGTPRPPAQEATV